MEDIEYDTLRYYADGHRRVVGFNGVEYQLRDGLFFVIDVRPGQAAVVKQDADLTNAALRERNRAALRDWMRKSPSPGDTA